MAPFLSFFSSPCPLQCDLEAPYNKRWSLDLQLNLGRFCDLLWQKSGCVNLEPWPQGASSTSLLSPELSELREKLGTAADEENVWRKSKGTNWPASPSCNLTRHHVQPRSAGPYHNQPLNTDVPLVTPGQSHKNHPANPLERSNKSILF